MRKFIAVLALVSIANARAHAERIGKVDAVLKFIRPDHEIVVDAYGDLEVTGITCCSSRARTGGLKAGLGPAEDKSEAMIACRQNGPVSSVKPLPEQEEVFGVSLSRLNDLRSSASTVSLMKCAKFIGGVALTMARE